MNDSRPWFGGHRSAAEQMLGLDSVFAYAGEASVLDLGCADGDIALEFMRRGAGPVHACEIMISRIRTAHRRRPPLFSNDHPLYFTCDLEHFAEFYDVNRDVLLPRYGIVLALSIAHKLKRPEFFLRQCCNLAAGMLAIRLPSPAIDDPRSSNVKLDVRAYVTNRGFALEAAPPTCRGEWLGIFRRK